MQQRPDSGELYFYGQTNMFQFPEFSDPENLKGIYKTMEDKTKILKILNQSIKRKGCENFHRKRKQGKRVG